MRRKTGEPMPERDHFLSTGEKVRIRQLSPAERLRLLYLPGDISFCRRLSTGLVYPRTSFRRAERLLQKDPFRALEIVRAIQKFTAEHDAAKQMERDNLENEAFLLRIRTIEQMKASRGNR